MMARESTMPIGDPEEGVEPPTLPDRYNGLGFEDLIYMVVELLDLHSQWMDIEENRSPLQLIFVEEREAHLHVQLQQVFIRKVFDILEIEGEESVNYSSQLVVTTDSPHILYDRGFRPIRYCRRCGTAGMQSTDVLNLSAFYDPRPPMQSGISWNVILSLPTAIYASPIPLC